MISASLGAHYSPPFVRKSARWWWRTLWGQTTVREKRMELQRELERRFGGEAVLVYKGRDAIELALRALGLTSSADVVLTQAFTCYAIEEAIVRAGATPHYVDIGERGLNLTVETLERARRGAGKNAKAVIVQHSLGHPADIVAIQEWCAQHSIVLIEDLAQSFGARANGHLLGTFGDATILSFGRDKIIDAVSGGAVVFRTPANEPIPALSNPPHFSVLKDLLYPFLTHLIRSTYDFGLGKIFHVAFKTLGLMSNPTYSPTNSITALPESLADLALLQLQKYETAHSYRQTLAALYLEGLENTPAQLITQPSDLTHGSLLRVALTVDDPHALLAELKSHGIHLADRWYRQPVDAGSLPLSNQYIAGSCPNAEKRAQTVINLPTHQKIRISDAEKIITVIQNFWQ